MATKRKNMVDFLGLGGGDSGSVSVKDGLKRDLPIDRLEPRIGQARKQIEPDELQTLAATIRELGIIQPIVVRPKGGNEELDRYEIVAGERRWRAARLAHLSMVPVIVRYLDESRAALYSLAENIARRNLNPIEQARGYEAILHQHRLTQTELAEAVGQNVKTLNRILRLLKLPSDIQTLIEQEQLSAKHGELLLSLPQAQQLRLAQLAVNRGWSVRELERQIARSAIAGRNASPSATSDPDLERERTLWSEQLGAAVKLHCGRNGKVRITITVNSLDEYEGIKERLLSQSGS
ncbi:MAG: ParB/RepB/Spo0J family partition protein [Candidatus Competibacteraceae bacterium]